MQPIKIGIVGVGNCASSLIQGIQFYSKKQKQEAIGILHWEINGYRPSDIMVSCAFDIDQRKVGMDVHQAIFQPPNCTARFSRDLNPSGTRVSMGRVLDGVAAHMRDHDPEYTFVLSDSPEPEKSDVVNILAKSQNI